MKKLILDKTPEHSTSNPYYDMIDGGFFPPESFSTDKDTIKRIREAYEIIAYLKAYLSEHDLIL